MKLFGIGAALMTVLAAIPLAAQTPASPPANAAAARAAALADPERRSDRAYYLTMRDGTRLAVNLYFPGHRPPAIPAPTALIQTRYGRALLFFERQLDPQRWRAAGYVVAIVDTRGSTSSFGPRDVDIGPDEVADMDEIIAHLARQPWSNGQVVATGFSYMADTADWAASRPAPALVAVIPRETDLDTYLDLFAPGGIVNDWFLNAWGSSTYNADLGRSDDGKLDCRMRVADCGALFPILQPVDDDRDFTLLRAALGGRRRWSPSTYAGIVFRDDKAANGYTLFASSSGSAMAAIRAQKKPTQYWGSWVDGGTAAAAIGRFQSALDVPTEVWITSNNHSNIVGADPLRPDAKTPTPSQDEQFARVLAFAERVRSGQPVTRSIHYAVMGTDRFESTPVWPPADARPVTLAFAAGHRLAAAAGGAGTDRYDVDFTATTGKATRWSTQHGIAPAYPDRRDEDAKLLHYDADPVAADTEVVGTPVVSLTIATATADPAFFVYLEDVAPDGRVTYLTEGQLRAVHRKPADPATLPYDQGPAPHSFKRADAMPMVPGRTATVRFALFPTAAVIRAGHHLRVAIAGGDDGIFRRLSEGKAERFDVAYGGSAPSSITLSLRPAAQSR